MYALYEDAATPPLSPPRGPGSMTATGTPRNCRACAGGEAGHNNKPRRGYMAIVSACNCHAGTYTCRARWCRQATTTWFDCIIAEDDTLSCISLIKVWTDDFRCIICCCAVGSAVDLCWWWRSHPSQHQGGTVRRLRDVQTQVCCPETSPLLQEVHGQRSVVRALAESSSQHQSSADVAFLRTCKYGASHSSRSKAKEGRATRQRMSSTSSTPERTVGVPYRVRYSKTAKAAWISRRGGPPREPTFDLGSWSDTPLPKLGLFSSTGSLPCEMHMLQYIYQGVD